MLVPRRRNAPYRSIGSYSRMGFGALPSIDVLVPDAVLSAAAAAAPVEALSSDE